MTFPTERESTLAMQWPAHAVPPTVHVPDGYVLYRDTDRTSFTHIQQSIGFTVTDPAWAELRTQLVPRSMVLADCRQTHAPVAVAVLLGAPGGFAELSWVAVSPEHRGNKLGAAICAAVIHSALSRGITRLFGSTQDHRLHALKIYLELGFVPVHRPEKVQRWRAVCDALDQPFTPANWQWPEPG